MKLLLSSGIGYRTHTLKELSALVESVGMHGLELNLPPRNRPTSETTRDTDYKGIPNILAIHAPGDTYDLPRFTKALEDTLAVANAEHIPLINIHPASLAYGGRKTVQSAIELIKKAQRSTTATICYEILVDPNGLAPDRIEHFKKQQAYYSIEEYLADIKEHNLPSTLDTAHLGTYGITNVSEWIEKFSPQLTHVHLSNYSKAQTKEHLPVNEGDVDLTTFLQTLQKTHPNITVTTELHPLDTREDVEQTIKETAKFIKNALS